MIATEEQTGQLSEIGALEERLEILRASGPSAALIEALLALGQAYLGAGNTPKALTQFEEGLEVAAERGEREAEARLWGYKGMALTHLGNTHFAQIALYKSHNLAKELDHALLLIDALMQLGLLQQEMGQSSKAVAKFEQALAEAMSAGDRQREMIAAGRAGDILLRLEAYPKALEYFSIALQAAEALGERRASGVYHLRAGSVFLADGAPAIAVEHFEDALNIADALEDPAAEVNAMAHLVRAHVAGNNARLAQLYSEHAMRRAREMGAVEAEFQIASMLSQYLVEQEQFKKALPFLERALELSRAGDDWRQQLTVYAQLGHVLYQLDRSDEALAHLREGLSLAVQLHDVQAEAQILGRISAAQAEQGLMQEAIETAERALVLAKESEDERLLGEQQMLLAFAYYDTEESERAAGFARSAQQTFEAMGDAGLAQRAQELLAMVA